MSSTTMELTPLEVSVKKIESNLITLESLQSGEEIILQRSYFKKDLTVGDVFVLEFKPPQTKKALKKIVEEAKNKPQKDPEEMRRLLEELIN
jgi:hypothetical protein